MKLLLALSAITVTLLLQSGCSAGASVGHDGHSHGVGVSGTDRGPGVGANVRAY